MTELTCRACGQVFEGSQLVYKGGRKVVPSHQDERVQGGVWKGCPGGNKPPAQNQSGLSNATV